VATAGTTAEGNKEMVLRYVEEVWNEHDLDAIDGLVSPEYINHAATTDEYQRGGARHIWEWLLSVFPTTASRSKTPRLTGRRSG
jgi:hypothetical protein